MFAGVFCFADDIALLAPCASALRKMLSICSSYAASHGLIFNSEKTQLICFRKYAHEPLHPNILFNGISLQYSDKVLHLGHLLSFDLNDRDDIVRATKDVNRKANYMIYTFRYLDPFAMTLLFKMYCLSLCGCILWSLSSSSLRRLQVAMNRKYGTFQGCPTLLWFSVLLESRMYTILFFIVSISLYHAVCLVNFLLSKL